MTILSKYLEKALDKERVDEGGILSTKFTDYIYEAIDYLGRAMNIAMKEKIPELKDLKKKQWIFYKR